LFKERSLVHAAKSETAVEFFSSNRTKIDDADKKTETAVESVNVDKKMFEVAINKNEKTYL
jgi:hypothetical protein